MICLTTGYGCRWEIKPSFLLTFFGGFGLGDRGHSAVSENPTIWRVCPGVRFRRLFDEAVLINEETDETLVLNDTAISFLERCDGERSVDEIITAMVEDFEVSAKELAEDLEPFIKLLAREGIIESD
jgi:hypothetical protein